MKMHLSGSRARRGKKSRSSQLNDRNLGRVVQRILEIEALETRLLLSGVGTGLHKKKVTFTDALGDKVTVQLTGPKGAYFDITLAGAAPNNADIDSILIHGGMSSTVLSITDTPVKYSHDTVGVTPGTWTPGVVNVGEIDATGTTALRGIALSGVIPANINLPGVVVGSIGLNPGKAPIIDRIMTTVTGSFPVYTPETPFVDFHTVTVGSVTGSISLAGVGTEVENFLGAITATSGGIHSIVGLNSDLRSTVTASGNIDNIQVYGAVGASISTTIGSGGNITLDVGNGGIGLGASVYADGNLTLTVSGGGLSGSFIAGGHINMGVGGGGIDDAVLQAGNGISGVGSSTATILINGYVEYATFHAMSGNIASVTVTGTDGVYETNFRADTGNIGTLTADNFDTVIVNAELGSIGGVMAHSATSDAIYDSYFHAGTTIGAITAQSDLAAGSAITGSYFGADTGFTGAITATVTGGPDAVAINNSTFRTGGDFAGAITATASNIGGTAGTNDAIYGSTFSALGSFTGGINVPKGNINHSTFLAGYDIGPNWAIDGTTATSDDRVGPSTGTPTFTSIAVGNGNVINSVFASGVTPGPDATFGNGNDNLNATGATIGTYTVNGSTVDSKFESASLFPLNLTHVFQGNTLIAFSGNIGDITLNGAFDNISGFSGNTITAVLGSIGNVFVHNSSPVGGDAIGTGNVLTAKTGIGDIVGITDGTGSGINGLTVNGDSSGRGLGSVGSIIGVATNAGEPGLNGIYNLTASGANVGMTLSAAATAFLSANLSTADNTAVAALVGTGGVVGYTNGTGFGIGGPGGPGGATTINALTSIGNVAGVVNSHYGRAGLYDVTAHAGVSIGNITGTTIADGNTPGGGTWNAISGIAHSYFYANAGSTATTGGTGTIGNVYGSATSSAAACNHYGIRYSGFYAGNGAAGTGHIGTVKGVATATGAKGTIYAAGLYATYIGAGGGAGGTGTIGDVTGTATAVSTTGKASAAGIGSDDTWIAAGYGTGGHGTIGNVSGTATATGMTGADATGVYAGSGISAGNGITGVGTIGTLTGTATATVSGFTTATAWAAGLYGTNVYAGGATGTIGNVSGTANATSTITGGNATAEAYGAQHMHLSAGTATGGVGTIGALVGGTISASGTATATANAGSATATGYGIDRSSFSAGGNGTGGVGTIASGGVTASGSATANSNTKANASAYGIHYASFTANSSGGLTPTTATIGAINASAMASATTAKTTTGNDTNADAGAIGRSSFTAGAGTGSSTTGYAGTIGNITTAATATSTTVGDSSSAWAAGVYEASFRAGGSGTISSGTIGTITAGTIATPIGATASSGINNASASAYGIESGHFRASSGGSSGTIGAIGAVTSASATVTGTTGNASVDSEGIDGATFTAGTLSSATAGGTGIIADAGITVTATGVAQANGGTADATDVYGLDGNSFTAGGAQSATALTGSGNIAATGGITVADYAAAVSTGNTASATAYAVDGGTYQTHGLTGTIGAFNITGAGTGTLAGVSQTGLAAFASTAMDGKTPTAIGYGLHNVSVLAANDVPLGTTLVYPTGTIGALNATVKVDAQNIAATAVTATTTDAEAYGILGGSIRAADNAAGGIGIIGSAGSTIEADATAVSTASHATSTADGIGLGVTIRAGGDNNPTTGTGIGTGTIGGITVTDTATTTVLPADTGSSAFAMGIASGIQAGSGGTTKGVGTIGSISATAIAVNTATAPVVLDAYGIINVTIQSGALDQNGAGTGGIGNITGVATTTGTAASGTAIGLDAVLAYAGTGIGTITGTSNTGTNGSFGIYGCTFVADQGSITAIAASTAGTNAIDTSTFDAFQNIGSSGSTAISVTAGAVNASQFLAGLTIGRNASYAAATNAWVVAHGENTTTAAVIGNVVVAGAFKSSDIVAGCVAGADNVFDDAVNADTDFMHGTIGTITIGPASYAPSASVAGTNVGHSIEAFAVGNVTIGNAAAAAVVASPGTDFDTGLTGGVVPNDGDVRVRLL